MEKCIALIRNGKSCNKNNHINGVCLEHIGTHICRCGRAIYKDEEHHRYCWNCGTEIKWSLIKQRQRGDKNKFISFYR